MGKTLGASPLEPSTPTASAAASLFLKLAATEVRPFCFTVNLERSLGPDQRRDPPAAIPGAALFFTTLAGAVKVKKTVHGVAVDEGNLAATIQGLAVMRAHPSLRHFVVVGDERQLPPLIQSQGLFHTRAFNSLLDSAELSGAATCDVSIQRRIPEDSAGAFGRCCYGRTLASQGVVPTAAIEFAKPGRPSPSQTSLSNADEKDWALKQVARLLEVGAGQGGWSIGILCYYSAQVNLIQSALTGLPARGSTVHVLTVDASEGLEFDATWILLSTATLNSYLADWQRALVALTRSKGPLLISCGQTWVENVPAAVAHLSLTSLRKTFPDVSLPGQDIAPFLVRHFEVSRRLKWLPPSTSSDAQLLAEFSTAPRVLLSPSLSEWNHQGTRVLLPTYSLVAPKPEALCITYKTELLDEDVAFLDASLDQRERALRDFWNLLAGPPDSQLSRKARGRVLRFVFPERGLMRFISWPDLPRREADHKLRTELLMYEVVRQGAPSLSAAVFLAEWPKRGGPLAIARHLSHEFLTVLRRWAIEQGGCWILPRLAGQSLMDVRPTLFFGPDCEWTLDAEGL